jgi:hypothetical protein
MKTKFSDLGIKSVSNHFKGNKLKISKVLNKSITVHGFTIKPSAYKGDCLNLQISIGTEYHVIFTGSTVLIDTIKKVPESAFPFETRIIEENEHYEFT